MKVTGSNFAKRFNLYAKDYYFVTRHANKRLTQDVIVLFVEGLDVNAKLSIVAQCFPRTVDKVPILFLKRASSTHKLFHIFECVHEIGHASMYGAECEALGYVEIYFVILSVIAAKTVGGDELISNYVMIGYFIIRAFEWFFWRRCVEPEVIADAFALKCDPNADSLAISVSMMTEILEKTAARTTNILKKIGVRGRARALVNNFGIYAKNGREALWCSPRQRNRVVLLLNLIVITAPIWGHGNVWFLVETLFISLAVAMLVLIGLTWWEESRKHKIEMVIRKAINECPEYKARESDEFVLRVLFANGD